MTSRVFDVRVVAVVVTFNRLELLQRLVERLDGPRARRGARRRQRLDRRHGGVAADRSRCTAARWPTTAAAPAASTTASSWAMERGADLVWLMDDDGLPEPDCLDAAARRTTDLDFWGPVVARRGGPRPAVLPDPAARRHPRRARDGRRSSGRRSDGLIHDVVIPFNGVLVTRELVERIGLPREEFFIWGDDSSTSGAPRRPAPGSPPSSTRTVLHPAIDDLGTPMMFGRTTYNHSPSDLKHYCMARNNLVNLRDYRGWPHALAFVAKTVWFYTFTRREPGRLRLSARAGVRRAARRLHRPPEVPRDDRSPSRDRRGRRRHLQPRRPARRGCSTGSPRRPRARTR